MLDVRRISSCLKSSFLLQPSKPNAIFHSFRAGRVRLWAAVLALVLLAPAAMWPQAPPPSSGDANVPSAESTGGPQFAPLNPEFITYMDEVRHGRPRPMMTVRGHALGYVPGPLDLSHLQAGPEAPLAVTSIPASYDLRTYGRVTKVKDQQQCGSCWAFAAYGSLESALLPAQTWDFSENNLKNLSGFDHTPCQGGGDSMSMAYLTRWSGPVSEADDLYDDSDTNTSPANATVRKHVQDVLLIPARKGPTDNDQLKSAIIAHGGVAASFFMDESNSYYNPSTSAYYYNDAATNSTNHGITLVGWDNNYSKTNFSQTPAGDGAFLVKNSWGTNWGKSGYFWISYYDMYLGKYTSASYDDSESTTNFAHRYEYDPLGWVASFGYTNRQDIWYASVYTATENGYLDAISTYVAANASKYELQIYTGVINVPNTGTKVVSDAATIPYAGYHTLTVTPVHVTKGQKFSIILHLTTPGYTYPAPLEYAVGGYSSKAVASPGQTFYGSDGATWTDITALESTASFSLKAFTVSDSTPPATAPKFTPAPGTYTTPQSVSMSAGTGATIYYTMDGSTPTTMSAVYKSAITVSGATKFRAMAKTSGHSSSAITTGGYTINLPAAAAPTFTPGGGLFGLALTVALKAPTANTAAYYTVNGSTPSTSSTKYTAPIPITQTATIKAIAAGAAYANSPVTSATYTLVGSPVVLTGFATQIATPRATLNALVNDMGAAGQVYFVWGTSPNALNSKTAQVSIAAQAGGQNVSATLGTLSAKTVYYFRPVVSTVGGISYGAVQSFKTN
jgi:C1A family cysteine protease